MCQVFASYTQFSYVFLFHIGKVTFVAVFLFSYLIVCHIVFVDVLPVVSCLVVITRSIKLCVEPAGFN